MQNYVNDINKLWIPMQQIKQKMEIKKKALKKSNSGSREFWV
jgi:hypothetical protein